MRTHLPIVTLSLSLAAVPLQGQTTARVAPSSYMAMLSMIANAYCDKECN